jgi:D-serine deaminase-like pyridoxal phosphate-dependent protein
MTYTDVITDDPLLGQPVTALPTPAAIVDLAMLDRNIATMAAFFADRPAALRPHAKTHRAPAVARRQLAAGAVGVTCAKVGMAEAMVDGGIEDVFIANQVVAPGAIARLCALGQRARVRVIADNAGNVAQLGAAATAAGITLPVLIEIDAGMGRCGTPPGEPALALATQIARTPGLAFAGIHVYEGHVVQHPDPAHRRRETEAMLDRALDSRDLLLRHGLPVETFTCGGTGTYAISGAYPGVTEHQSGSYVYMDPGYRDKLPEFGLAFGLLCTVVSRPTAEKVITDAGLQSLHSDGTPEAEGHPELRFGYLSEEHGTFLVRDGERTDLAIGETLIVHPGHCCAAANLHDRVYAIRDGQVAEVWRVTARGRSQ